VAVRAGEGDIDGVPALGMYPERAFEDGALVCVLDFTYRIRYTCNVLGELLCTGG